MAVLVINISHCRGSIPDIPSNVLSVNDFRNSLLFSQVNNSVCLFANVRQNTLYLFSWPLMVLRSQEWT